MRGLFPALLLAGCGSHETCPTFDEMVVSDPGGTTDSEHLDRIREQIDLFAEWSGRSGVCVDEVRVVDGLQNADGEDRAGLYGGRLIRIDAGSVFTGETLFHELCHAVDAQDGWISETRPDLFGSHPHEAFAEACSVGPVQLGLAGSLDAMCGTEVSLVPAFVDEIAYAGWEDTTTPAEGTVPVTLDTREIDGLPASTTPFPVAAGDSLFVLSGSSLRPRAARAPRVQLLEVDPSAAAVVDKTLWPIGAQSLMALPSDGDPMVLDPDQQRVWRRDPAGGFDELVLPDLGGGMVVWGLVQSEQALLISLSPDELVYSRWLADLETGEARELALPDELSSFLPMEVSSGRFAGEGRGADGHAYWISFDPTSETPTCETWTSTPMQWNISSGTELADGRILAIWTLSKWTFDIESDRLGLAVLDEGSGQWWLAEDACDGSLASIADLLSTGDEHWLWEWNPAWPPDGPTRTGDLLSRVSVGTTD